MQLNQLVSWKTQQMVSPRKILRNRKHKRKCKRHGEFWKRAMNRNITIIEEVYLKLKKYIVHPIKRTYSVPKNKF